MLGKRIAAIAGSAAILIALGTAVAFASADSTSAAVPSGFQAASIACLPATCVILGDDAHGEGKTAALDPSKGSTNVNRGTLKYGYASGNGTIACPDKTTCLAAEYYGIVAITTKNGAQKLATLLPTTAQYQLLSLACPSSKYCYTVGYTAPIGVQLPTRALLAKVSPAGRVLSESVDKGYESYGPIGCESDGVCLMDRETTKFVEQVVPVVNGKIGTPHTLAGLSAFSPYSIVCYSDKLCYETGNIDNTTSGLGRPALIPLNPKTGVPGKIIKLPFTTGNYLTTGPLGLACYSSTQCVAVSSTLKGSGTNQTTEAVYAVIDNGKVGKVSVASTKPAASLFAVSCSSAKHCYAVGQYFNPKDSTYNPTIVVHV